MITLEQKEHLLIAFYNEENSFFRQKVDIEL